MAESTSASASYSSSSTSFAADTATVVSDCEVRDSGEKAEVEAGSSTKVVPAEITHLCRDSKEEKNQS